tara:strand:+ start:5742 stop:6611 length:870 start_codon:yes stop_codon:yes gene_type:complete
MIHKLLINLDTQPKRLINTLNELKKIDENDYIIRINACSDEKAKQQYYKYISSAALNNINNIQNTAILPNYAAVGCAISHIKCWEYIVNNNLETTIIMEDDIEFKNESKFKIEFNKIKKLIKKHNDIAFFFTLNSLQKKNTNSNYCYCETEKSILNTELEIEKIRNVFIGTFFYLINNKMAKLLLDNIYNIKYQIDIEIGLFAKKYIYNDNKAIFLNIKTDTLQISKKFKSTIQYYNITLQELEDIFSISEDIALCIYNYIPTCFKKNKQLNINNNEIYNYENSINFLY